MPRLLFEKTGNAIWISHLDLMRVFQRSFKRAGLKLTHTQGYNPRPSVSIALPLSVGVESLCELLDFDLDGEQVELNSVAQRLNAVLVDGVKVLEVYEQGSKIRNLTYLHCSIELIYDRDMDEDAVTSIDALFKRASLVVEKKTKNGLKEQDIIPLIRNLDVKVKDNKAIILDALICCQNPTLNPNQIVQSIETYLPQYRPDFVKYCRLEVYDQQNNIFR